MKAYGVVIVERAGSLAVDHEATEQLRSVLRRDEPEGRSLSVVYSDASIATSATAGGASRDVGEEPW